MWVLNPLPVWVDFLPFSTNSISFSSFFFALRRFCKDGSPSSKDKDLASLTLYCRYPCTLIKLHADQFSFSNPFSLRETIEVKPIVFLSPRATEDLIRRLDDGKVREGLIFYRASASYFTHEAADVWVCAVKPNQTRFRLLTLFLWFHFGRFRWKFPEQITVDLELRRQKDKQGSQQFSLFSWGGKDRRKYISDFHPTGETLELWVAFCSNHLNRYPSF